MKKTLVAYYSNTGNNRFLSHKIANSLNCDIEEIKPVINAQLLMMARIGLGVKKTKTNLSDYDRIILCGPVWMGSFIYPLKSFVDKYKNKVNEWDFVTCCGSSYKLKDDKYGHEMVFNKIKELYPDLNIKCTALPITMTMPDKQQDDVDTMMKARLNEDNFDGLFHEKFEEYIESLN